MESGIDGARTRERFEKRENKRFKRDGFGATDEFVALDLEWGLVERLAAYILTQLQKPTQLNLLLRDLDLHELALVVVASLMHSALVGREDPEMTIDIGKAVQDFAFESKVLRPEKYSRRVGRAAMEAGYRSKEWSVENEVQAGNLLLDFCLGALPDVFQIVRGSGGVKAVRVPDEKEDEAVAIYERLLQAHPVFTPRTSPPKPWSGWRDRGYDNERERASSTFVTGAAAHHEETKKAFRAAFRSGSMKQHLDGVHALESVPYRINEPVLDALSNYYLEMLEERFRKKQRRLEDKKKKMAAAGASDKAMHWINGQIKAHEKQFKQDKRQFKVDLAEAERLKGAPFYLELRCDFRGRVYPLSYFHYQRGDHIRSLFLFDRGLPIGSEQSIRRLKDYAASCWGHGLDKKTLPERRQWVDDDENWSLIERTAKLESKEWFKADNPFLFLAACIELVAAVAGGPNYITRLPIAFDGLCNGLLHFCALTRQDPIGLMAAGSTATPAVDTYMVVASRVEAMFGSEERYQHIKPDRALAKQPTQTFFYGATNTGRSGQIQAVPEERDDVSLPSDPSEAAKLYYAIGEDHRKAIENLFDGAKGTMDFLQDMARVLAKQGKPLQWPTPTGFPLVNRYEEYEYKTVNSTLRGVRARRKIAVGYKPVIRVGKSKNAVAANVIHALDASHMMRTAKACNAAGIDIMGIHDCYICLAPQAENLDKTIRQELVRMYSECDPLTEIRERALQSLAERPRILRRTPSQMADALAQHPLAVKGKRVAKVVGIQTPSFPDVPKLGLFDLREFLKNVYAFSS